eukprot:356387-Chlamydomonas_euryale.AAC.4
MSASSAPCGRGLLFHVNFQGGVRMVGVSRMQHMCNVHFDVAQCGHPNCSVECGAPALRFPLHPRAHARKGRLADQILSDAEWIAVYDLGQTAMSIDDFLELLRVKGLRRA